MDFHLLTRKTKKDVSYRITGWDFKFVSLRILLECFIKIQKPIIKFKKHRTKTLLILLRVGWW